MTTPDKDTTNHTFTVGEAPTLTRAQNRAARKARVRTIMDANNDRTNWSRGTLNAEQNVSRRGRYRFIIRNEQGSTVKESATYGIYLTANEALRAGRRWAKRNHYIV